MAKRKVININEELCNGCGNCIPNCPEGALQIIDGKARLVSDLFCDGLGACIGECPVGAITTEEREALPYDEKKVMENIVKQGENVIKAHLKHLKDHNEKEYLKQAFDYLKVNGIEIPDDFKDGRILEEETEKDENTGCASSGVCPGSQISDFTNKEKSHKVEPGIWKKAFDENPENEIRKTQLNHWPIQIKLVPPNAPFLQNSSLLIAADCVPFTHPDFHEKFLKGKVLLIGCPKFDDAQFYLQRISDIVSNNDIKSITVVYMEVPCCFGLISIAQEAIKRSGKIIPFVAVKISIKGEII
ncbi:MAG: 4Fe-4S binding protein [Actinomycetota bacterium]|nr:4Fe-4S binding protein [Actinomycetota bacterium]